MEPCERHGGGGGEVIVWISRVGGTAEWLLPPLFASFFLPHFRGSENLDDPAAARGEASARQLDFTPRLEDFQPAVEPRWHFESKSLLPHLSFL